MNNTIFRILLQNSDCHNCKYGTKRCNNYKYCNNCPIVLNNYCPCVQQATNEEVSNLKCKYFTEKE